MSRVPEAYLEARTDEIREAALRVFCRHGVEGATMQEIAREAGVSAGAIYRYFSSKEALLAAVFEDCGERNRQLFEESLATSGSPLVALMKAGRVVWDSFAAEGALAQFTVNVEGALVASRTDGEFGAQFRALHAVIGDQIAEMVRHAQAAGELDPSIDAESLALTLIACFEGTKLLFVEQRGALPADAVYEVLARMLRAFAPAGG